MTPPRTKKEGLSKAFVCVCLAGFAFGLLGNLEGLARDQHTDSRRWALIGFFFFCTAMVLIGLVERLFTKLVRILQKTGGRPGPRIKMQSCRWFKAAGWFVVALATGLAMSAFWRGQDLLWMSLEAFGPGLGLLLGIRLREMLFVEMHPTE